MSQFTRDQLDSLWREFIQNIEDEKQLDDLTIKTVFDKETYLYDINEGLAIIVVPYTIQYQIFSKINDYVSLKFSQLTKSSISCQVVLKDEINKKEKQQKEIKSKQRSDELLVSKINSEYTFDNFIIGKSNREAHAAAVAACEYPATINNPLFIYGNSGLGKTHLLHAICNQLKESKPDQKILYIYSDDFVELLIDSLRNKTIDEVKDKISKVDYLLIDDIQRLKQSNSQEIFFSLYNRLISSNKHIIITSDMPPIELKGIEDRLISRFSAGLSVSIGSPEFETAKAILKMKLEGRSEETSISDDVLDYIATKFSSDVRALEGALNRIIFQSIMDRISFIDLEFAKKVFSKEVEVFDDNQITPLKIKQLVCDFYGLTIDQLESKNRTKNIANARHIAIYLCRKHLQLPFVKIGFEFGNRDHSTIKSSFDRIRKLSKENKQFTDAIEKIESKLNL